LPQLAFITQFRTLWLASCNRDPLSPRTRLERIARGVLPQNESWSRAKHFIHDIASSLFACTASSSRPARVSTRPTLFPSCFISRARLVSPAIRMSDAVTASELLYALQHGSPLPPAFAAQLQEGSPPAVYDFVPPLPPRATRAAASTPAPQVSPPPAPESPSSDEEQPTTHRCSQCKQERGLDEFPTRLTTLQPFLVCKTHLWYWTPAKRELHWAPEGISTMETVCSEVQEVVSGERAAGSWIVRGVAEDRNAIVMRVAAVQGWVALPV
jgi:hypothetical protein